MSSSLSSTPTPPDGPYDSKPISTPSPTDNLSNPSSSVHSPTPLPSKWAVATAASVVHGLHATAVYVAPTTLLSPMRDSLNLSIAQVTLPLNVFRAVQAVFLIPAGFALDAIGPQRSLRLSITAAALLAPFLPLVTTLPHLLILQTLFSVTKLFGGLSALLLIITGAFGTTPGVGTATSILLSGYSFAGFLAPAVIGALSSRVGWRGAFSVLSTLFIVIALPLTFYFLREHPHAFPEPRSDLRIRFQHNLNRVLKSDIGIFDASIPGAEAVLERRPPITSTHQATLARPPGSNRRNLSRGTIAYQVAFTSSRPPAPPSPPAEIDVAQHNERPSHAPDTPLETAETVAQPGNDRFFTGPFLAIATAVAAFSFTMNIVFDHLLVFLNEDFGLPFNTATFYISALNLIALVSKLSAGPLADRFNMALLIAFFSIMGVLASFLLLDFSGLVFTVTASLPKVMGFVIFYGIAYAGVFSVTTSVLPEFGTSKLGVRTNFNLMLLYLSGSLGSLASGVLRSNSGSYKWPFVLNAVSFAIAAIAGMVKYFVYDRRRPTKLLPR